MSCSRAAMNRLKSAFHSCWCSMADRAGLFPLPGCRALEPALGTGEPAILIGVGQSTGSANYCLPRRSTRNASAIRARAKARLSAPGWPRRSFPYYAPLSSRWPCDDRRRERGGDFVVETWLAQPDLFDGYAALSPSLQWNDSALAGAAPADDGTPRPRLFLSLADEGGAARGDGIARDTGCALLLRRLSCIACPPFEQPAPIAAAGPAYLLPTEADWLGGVECEMREADAE